jgi:hypothetical protein
LNDEWARFIDSDVLIQFVAWTLKKNEIGPSNQPLGSLNGTMGQVGGAGSMGSGGAGPSHTHPHPHTPSPPHPSAAPPHSQHSASMSPKSFHFEGLLTGASNSGTLPDLFG